MISGAESAYNLHSNTVEEPRTQAASLKEILSLKLPNRPALQLEIGTIHPTEIESVEVADVLKGVPRINLGTNILATIIMHTDVAH